MNALEPGAPPLEPGAPPLEERSVYEVLAGVGRYTACVNEPPWSTIVPGVPAPARLIVAWNMDIEHLEGLLEQEVDSDAVVGLGGGSAMDTAKFVAWKTGKRLILVPSITSVDAAFTDAVGVRVQRKVRYVGRVSPAMVVLDVDLVRSAPEHLNRSGIGDILSCHTALWDWRYAVANGKGVPWDDTAAALGVGLLKELIDRADAVNRVTPDAVRWLASAYSRIGAMCNRLRHSRFEEGSEHFFGYVYEHLTGAHPMHGELIALCTMAMSTLQQNEPDTVHRVIESSGIRAHPEDIGMDRSQFVAALSAIRDYVAREGLDFSVIDRNDLDSTAMTRLWDSVVALPRR